MSEERISTQREEIQLATRMAVEMLKKLRANRGKPHWENERITYLALCLREEVEELIQATHTMSDPAEVWKEAGDVANFAAMMASTMEALLGKK